MLTYVNDSLFDSPAQTLVNTVNTVGVMGKGIAAEFKRRYPEMYRLYRKHCEDGLLDIGKLSIYRTPNHWVLNFPTKKNWRQPSRIEWIEEGLKKFVATYTDQGIVSVSFPMLGCGNGQLEWEEVKPLMEKYLDKLPIPVFIHVADGGRFARPEHKRPEALSTVDWARETVTLLRFWNDLRTAVGLTTVSALPDEEDRDGTTIELPIDGGRAASIPFTAIEALFELIRMKGVLHPTEFPEALTPYAEHLEQLLLELPYIEEATLAAGSKRRPAGRAVRFAPPPALRPHATGVQTLST